MIVLCISADHKQALFFIWLPHFTLYLEFCFQLEKDELQPFISSLLESSTQTAAENLWHAEVLGEGDLGQLKGFKDDVTPGDALIKFFEHYSTLADDDRLHIRHIKNPMTGSEEICPNVSQEESGRFSDAALHAFHELAQCCGLDSLTASNNTENTRELKETLQMPNTTWGALRFAEAFVQIKLSRKTSSLITIRPGNDSYWIVCLFICVSFWYGMGKERGILYT